MKSVCSSAGEQFGQRCVDLALGAGLKRSDVAPVRPDNVERAVSEVFDLGLAVDRWKETVGFARHDHGFGGDRRQRRNEVFLVSSVIADVGAFPRSELGQQVIRVVLDEQRFPEQLNELLVIVGPKRFVQAGAVKLLRHAPTGIDRREGLQAVDWRLGVIAAREYRIKPQRARHRHQKHAVV